MERQNQLRGEVLSEYKSISEFARVVGWSRNKALRIVNGVQAPDTRDICEMTNCLDVGGVNDFLNIFLRHCLQNRQFSRSS